MQHRRKPLSDQPIASQDAAPALDIREDILREADAPMLKHGLQGFQGIRILIPGAHHLRPAPDYLAERYELFKKAG